MVLPRWLARINKRTFNRMEIRRGVRPVLIHVGRTSGRAYETPLDAHPVDGGYVFIPNYGPDSDWVKNILAAGTARLRTGSEEADLTAPRLVATDDVLMELPEKASAIPRRLKLTRLLRMDVTNGAAGTSI